MNGKGELVIVTGAAKGIGRAVAEALALEHARNVLAISRDKRGLEILMSDLAAGAGAVEILPLDLMDRGSIEQVVDRVGGRRVTGLVNNAGRLLTRPMGQWTGTDLQDLLGVNAIMPMLLCQALADRLDGDPPGHVVNIGSMGGVQGSVKFPGLVGYSASKAALANITECLAVEWKDRGIRCNCLAIGSVDTAMFREAFPGHQAANSTEQIGRYIARFAVEGHLLFNGKVLPVSSSTP